VDGNLTVADKPVVKELASTLALLLKGLGGSKKLVLTPLARYWVTPCCSESGHLTNYRSPGYLLRLGEAVAALRDHIRDAFFMQRVSNFRVLCPNRMFGIGLRRQDISDEEATRTAALWGPDPMHPTSVAYRMIAEAIEADLQDLDVRYTNPPKQIQTGAKKARHDPSQERAGWVEAVWQHYPAGTVLQCPGKGATVLAPCPASPDRPRAATTAAGEASDASSEATLDRAAGETPFVVGGEATCVAMFIPLDMF
jgi:hypothetical protein